MIDPLECLAPLKYRIIGGITIFAVLAFVDWRKNGAKATRLKEYSFVLLTVTLTIAYAVIHDLITATISAEYFVIGKGLDQSRVHLQAAWLATQAAYGPGLVVGVIYVICNNPSERYPQLPNRKLLGLLLWPLAMALGVAFLFGLFGNWDLIGKTSEVEALIQNPKSFLTVWGIHWGTYVGGSIGAVIGGFRIRSLRRMGLG